MAFKKLLMVVKTLLILISVARLSLGQYPNECTLPIESSLNPCGACLAIKGCAWCHDPQFEDKKNSAYRTFHRCNTRELMDQEKLCQENYILDPRSELRFSKMIPASKDFPVSPQELRYALRVGQPLQFEMTYKDTGNKPLDLYYIMDLSATMKDDKITVANQSKDLADALKKITQDVQLGFGSFIDKPLLPFASSVQLQNNIEVDTNNAERSVPPYGFKNHLRLTEDSDEFKRTVTEAQISRNLDSPEGGLEAIMQAIVCTEQIGWRNGSRKLLILSTDGPFHIAGDGKLGGLVQPNDGLCHMPNNYEYTHATKLDYPSIAQINNKVRDNQVYVIFAITQDNERIYKKLKDKIESSSVVTLSGDSSNVVQVVESEYRKISSSLRFEQIDLNKNINPGVKITYRGTCPGTNTPFEWTGNTEKECKNFPVDSEIKINVTVELLKCPKTKRPGESLGIKICPFEHCSADALKLVIEPICDCPSCKISAVPNSPVCSFNGTLECGSCVCDKQFRGRNCDCAKMSNDEADEEAKNNEECIKSGDSSICSGRGECNCRTCDCKKEDGRLRYHGQYCEFDEDVCKGDNGLICSGNGTCSAEKCRCNEGWEGDKCDCSTNKTDCMEPGKTTVCNNQGECSCKQKICTNCRGFTGKFCHIPTTTRDSQVSPRCKDDGLLECVKCRTMMNNECTAECNPMKKTVDVRYSVEVVNEFAAGVDRVPCKFQDAQDCEREFVHWYTPERELKVQLHTRTNYCPISSTKIIIIVVLSIVLIGIFLLLIWKVITHVHDKREYTRFEKERSGAKWDQATNPLYVGPESNFQNPAYNRSHRKSHRTSKTTL